jgi:hypothetical protein
MSTTLTPLPTGLEQANDLLADYARRTNSIHRTSSEQLDDLCTTQEAVVFAHLRDMWLCGQAESLVITPDVVDRQIDLATIEPLSADERDRVADEVMNSTELLELMDAARTAFQALVRSQADAVIGRRAL